MAARRGASLYLVSSGVAQVSALVRYTVLARLLGPSELGLAASIILVSQFFDSVSDVGVDRFVIQDSEGDTAPVQAGLQAFLVLRGLTTATLMLLCAGLAAQVFRSDALKAGVMLLAAFPVVMGFVHLDLKRVQRQADFRPEALAQTLSEVASALVTIAVAYFLRSYIAVVFGLIARAAVLVVTSRVTAKRPYRLSWRGIASPKLIRFAGPLTLNGILLFATSQSDRVVIGNQLGATQLGLYSAVILLIANPSGMLARFLGTIFLPQVARETGSGERPAQAADALAGVAIVIAFGMMLGFTLVAPIAIRLLFGQAFAQSRLLICVIGILQCARLLRTWPTTVAIGLGRTGIVLANTVVRLSAVPLGVAGLWLTHDLFGVACGFALGELLAVAMSAIQLNLRTARPLVTNLDRVALFCVGAGCTLAWAGGAAHAGAAQVTLLAIASAGVALAVLIRERQLLQSAQTRAIALLGGAT